MKIKINTSGLGIDWQENTTYTIEAENNAFIDVDGTGNLPATIGTITTNTGGPEIYATDPVDDSTFNMKEYEIEIQFNRLVQLGTGNIYLYHSDSTLIKTWTQADVDVHDDKIYLDAFSYLQPNQNYFLLMDSGLIKDIDGFEFDGIDTTTTYNIKNGDFTAPNETYITKITGEGVYNTTTPTAITNNPTLVNASNCSVAISVESNSSYVNGFEYDDYSVFTTEQLFSAPDPDTYTSELYGWKHSMSSNNLRLSIYELNDADGPSDTSQGTVYTYIRDSEDDSFPTAGYGEITCSLTPGQLSDFKMSANGNRLAIVERNSQDGTSANVRGKIFNYGGSGSKFNNLIQTIDLRFNRHLSTSYQLNANVDDISNDGNYVLFNTNGTIEAGQRNEIHVYAFNGSTYDLQNTFADSDVAYRNGRLNSDGSLLTMHECHISGGDSGKVYVCVYARSGSSWSLVGTKIEVQASSNLPIGGYGLGGDYILADNKIYTTDGSSITLQQTLTTAYNYISTISRNGNRIFEAYNPYFWEDYTDSTTPQFQKSAEQLYAFNTTITVNGNTFSNAFSAGNQPSPDGNYVGRLQSGTSGNVGGFLLQKYKDKPPTSETATAITFEGNQPYINTKLNSLKLNVDSDIPTTDPYDYDGEMKIKYTFDTTVDGGDDVGIIYRHQRTYKE
jgi:hypothetical protein